MKIEKRQAVTSQITALKDYLRKKFLTPARIEHMAKNDTIEVEFIGSDSPSRPETLGTVEIQHSKVAEFEQMLEDSGASYKVRHPETRYVDYNNERLEVKSTIITFDASEIAKVCPARKMRGA